MSVVGRVASRMSTSAMRLLCVLLAGFALAAATESRGARLDASGQGGDVETARRRAEGRLLDLPLFWNGAPADGRARVRAALKRVEDAVDEGVAAGLTPGAAVAAIGDATPDMPDAFAPPPRRVAESVARLRLSRAGDDVRTIVRYGALGVEVVVAERAGLRARDREALIDRLEAAFRERGTSFDDVAPPGSQAPSLVRAIVDAAVAGRLADVPPSVASKASYLLPELAAAQAALDDASAARLVRAVESWTAVPTSGISSDDPESRKAMRAAFERTMRRRGFALTASEPSFASHLTETRFFRFLADVVALDFGDSSVVAASTPVTTVVAERLPATLVLCGSALVVAFILGILSGVRASRGSGEPGLFAVAASSLPEAWIGTALLLAASAVGATSTWVDGLAAAACLAVPASVPVARLVDARLRAVRRASFADASVLLGASEESVDRRHALPRLRGDLSALLAVALPSVVGGSVVVESLFGFRGIGALLAEAALTGDAAVVMGVVMLVGSVTVVSHALFVVDDGEIAS